MSSVEHNTNETDNVGVALNLLGQSLQLPTSIKGMTPNDDALIMFLLKIDP